MMVPPVSLLGAIAALLGAVSLAALGAAIIMRRGETNSLFVEDRMGFVVTKVVLASILIVVGMSLAYSAIGRLITLG
jgi:hypothetical protein